MARTGFKAQIYVNDELGKGVQDFTVTHSRTEIQSKSRGSIYVKYLKGMKDCPIDFEITRDDNDPVYQALMESYHSDADDSYLPIEITNRKKGDGPWVGFKADWEVTAFEEGEPMDDEARTQVSIRLAAMSDFEPTETSGT